MNDHTKRSLFEGLLSGVYAIAAALFYEAGASLISAFFGVMAAVSIIASITFAIKSINLRGEA